jgi:hypothetical protein
MKKIADDLAAYYVLGYYTTNTAFDGGVRTIKVRYKTNGKAIRAAPAVPRADAGRDRRARGRAAAVGVGRRRRRGAEPRESALIVLDRASRPFAGYVRGGREEAHRRRRAVGRVDPGGPVEGGGGRRGRVGERRRRHRRLGARPARAGRILGRHPARRAGEWPARVTIRLRGRPMR